MNNTFLIRLTRFLLLIGIVSSFLFFYFFYNVFDANSNRIPFDVTLDVYQLFIFLSLPLSFWNFSSKGLRNIFCVGLFLFLTYFVPGLYSALSYFLTPLVNPQTGLLIMIIVAVLFALNKAITYWQARDLSRHWLLTVSVLLFLGSVIPTWYDLSIKQILSYKGNTLFDSINDCDKYIYPKRSSDCRKDYKMFLRRTGGFSKEEADRRARAARLQDKEYALAQCEKIRDAINPDFQYDKNTASEDTKIRLRNFGFLDDKDNLLTADEVVARCRANPSFLFRFSP